MKKFFLSSVILLYIFLFGLFTYSENKFVIFAADCSVNSLNPFAARVPPGTLQCAWFSENITECQEDSSWKNYYDCNNQSPPSTCENYGTPPEYAARCKNQSVAPSPTPTPTATIVPTATPTQPPPDPNVFCTYPDRKNSDGSEIKYNVGVKICDPMHALSADFQVYECVDKNGVGDFQKIGICNGRFDVPKMDTSCPYVDNNDHSKGDICYPDNFVPNPTPDPVCDQTPKPAQQWMPKPGDNCGIPPEKKDPSQSQWVTACCYSRASDLEVAPLSCFIGLPGAEDFFKKLDDKINQVFNCLPNISNCSEDEKNTDILNIGNVKKALKEIPPCMPGSRPKTVDLENGTVDLSSVIGKDDGNNPLCTCEPINSDPATLCENIKKTNENGELVPDTAEQTDCSACMNGDGIWTAIGCIKVSSENGFIQSLFGIGISLGGAFALLCNIYGAFLFQTSRGNPEGIKKAQDLITSCITGLLLIIFSIFILRLIGYNILRIPGFG